MNYWSNYPRVLRQPDEIVLAMRRRTARALSGCRNGTRTYDVIKYFNMMDKGDNVTGYICGAFNQ